MTEGCHALAAQQLALRRLQRLGDSRKMNLKWTDLVEEDATGGISEEERLRVLAPEGVLLRIKFHIWDVVMGQQALAETANFLARQRLIEEKP